MNDESKTSQTLLEQAIEQSESAWAQMVQTYYPLISYWARKPGLNEQDRENICQDVFLRVYRFLPRFQVTKRVGSFRSWLKTIVCHAIFDYRQRNNEIIESHSFFDLLAAEQDQSTSSSPSLDAERQFVFFHVMNLVCGEFSETHAEAFRQVVIEQAPAPEVAAKLNVTPNVVYQAKSRILARIRTRLQELNELGNE